MLVVGGTDAERLAAGPVQYTPAIDPNSYVIGIESITVGDEPLPMPEDGVALPDTGTTQALIPHSVFDAFQKVSEKIVHAQKHQSSQPRPWD